MAAKHCKHGFIVPVLPLQLRSAAIYFACLLYCFLGTALLVDVFMRSIEKLTSATIKFKRKKVDKGVKLLAAEGEIDEPTYDRVPIWNPTVANLTVMAVGSSAPEILLTIAETVERGYHSGELGPGTIVGTAAFNLFCVTAICVLVAPSPEAKRIVVYRVFVATSIFSVFAYVWVFLVLHVISPNIVEVWEGALTISFFFMLVIIAYSVDVELWRCPRWSRDHDSESGPSRAEVEPSSLQMKIEQWAHKYGVAVGEKALYDTVPEMQPKTVRSLAKHVASAFPMLNNDDQAKVLAYNLHKNVAKDRMYYRRKAVGSLTSSLHKREDERDAERIVKKHHSVFNEHSRVEFSARVYAISPSDRQVKLKIVRQGPTEHSLTVHFTTVNGSVKRDLHFLFKSQTVQFLENEFEKLISVDLVDGASFKQGDVFYVELKLSEADAEHKHKTNLGICRVAQVRVANESSSIGDRGSFVEFVESNYIVKENIGSARIFVTRGGRKKAGNLKVTYETTDGTAKENSDYVPVKDGVLEFAGQEYEKYVDIRIIDDDKDERDETFAVSLRETDDPSVSVGSRRRTSVTIVSDDNIVNNFVSIHKLVGVYLQRMKHGEETWREQIVNAASVNSGDVENASVKDALLHTLALPWKLLIAFVPPPSLFQGVPCFIVSLALICLVTTAIGEMASLFGCILGLDDTVTAITLVTVGMSLPDALASKYAAKHDENADDAIGHITGANCANVFLGLGISWTMSAVHFSKLGKSFVVESGELYFSVSVFLICALLFFMVLTLRRKLPTFGCGELGGPDCPKVMSGIYFLLIWLAYILVSVWRIYMPMLKDPAGSRMRLFRKKPRL